MDRKFGIGQDRHDFPLKHDRIVVWQQAAQDGHHQSRPGDHQEDERDVPDLVGGGNGEIEDRRQDEPADVPVGADHAGDLSGRTVADGRDDGEDGEVHAVGNLDPFSNAAVLSRGIVGDRCGVPKVASPVYKQSFDLRSGTCLDDSSARIPVYGARVTAGTVQVSASPHR